MVLELMKTGKYVNNMVLELMKSGKYVNNMVLELKKSGKYVNNRCNNWWKREKFCEISEIFACLCDFISFFFQVFVVLGKLFIFVVIFGVLENGLNVF